MLKDGSGGLSGCTSLNLRCEVLEGLLEDLVRLTIDESSSSLFRFVLLDTSISSLDFFGVSSSSLLSGRAYISASVCVLIMVLVGEWDFGSATGSCSVVFRIVSSRRGP